eukprot:scaffold9117_cov57-Attheya_sp.AAC.2
MFKLAAALSLLVASASATHYPFAPMQNKRNANSAYVNQLVRGAKATANSQIRSLEEEEIVIDISSYSVMFDKCQFVKAYDEEIAATEDYGTVLGTKRFVMFRLCPNNSCSSCNSGYGEYLIDMDSYLAATVEYQQGIQEEMCENCYANCQQDQYYEAEDEQEEEDANDGDEDGDEDQDEDERRRLTYDCDTCYDECTKIDNMEDNGYIDATEFIECQMIYDPEDDGKSAYYAGAMCGGSGTKIKIGVFDDEECSNPTGKDIEDYLVDGDGVTMKLSHALLKSVYSDSCISCLQVDDEEDNGDGDYDNYQADETNELCQALYEEAAKCEQSHGFDTGYSNYEEYSNQAEQENLVCKYMSALESGTYDESGEIVIAGMSSSRNSGSKTSGGQKFALTFFILGTAGLAVYGAMLHQSLTKGSGGGGLSSQGGAMA